MRAMWAAGAAIVLCLVGGGLPVAAQEATPSAASAAEETLFEVTVPVRALPETLEKINLESQTIEPGADLSIPAGNESMRGRVMYIDAGELDMTPMVDALVWTAGASMGGTPVAAPAGQAVHLAAGDAILLPAIPPASVDPDGVVRIANPGSVPAVTVGLHLHQQGGSFPWWPAGMTGGALATAYGKDPMAAVSSGDTIYRLVRLTVPAGERLALPEGAALVFFRVEEGVLDRTATGPGGTTSLPLSKGMGGVIATGDPVTYDLMAGGDAPVVVLELAAVPLSVRSPSPSPGM